MSIIFTSQIARLLKRTLRDIAQDDTDGMEEGLITKKWAKIGSMDEAYVEDMEWGGLGLFSESGEGEEIEADSIKEGPVTRYTARKFAKKVLITEEAVEDNKYKEVLDMGRKLKRAAYHTFEFDCTNILARGFNSNYPGADDQPLFSNAHPLIGGGTASNLMATPMSPSMAAVNVAITQIMDWPSHDGMPQMDLKPIKIVYPNAQWAAWATVLKSSLDPTPGNFSAINTTKLFDIEAIRNPFWQNTTTNWVVITNADNGIQVLWRRKWRSRTWVHEDNEVMVTARSGRWARGWTDWRGALGVNA